MMSIFGQPKQPTSNIFGSSSGTPASGSQSQAPPVSNFFSNLNTSQPAQQSSIFDGQSKTFSSTSFLGKTQPQQTNTVASGTSGLLGSTIIGGSQGISQQPGSNTGLQNPTDSQASRVANQSGYFDSLLEKGKKRARGKDEGPGFGEVPSIQLGLGDIAQRVRALGSSGAQGTEYGTGDSKAHYLLAASGVNPGTTLRDLNSFNAQTGTTTIPVQHPSEWEPDSHKYVEQLQQRLTEKMIEEGIQRVNRNFEAYLEENIDINWEAQRKKIYEHFGLTPKGGDALSNSTIFSNLGNTGGFGKSSRRGRGANLDRSENGVGNRSILGRSGMQRSVIGNLGVDTGNATLFGDSEDTSSTAPLQESRSLREKQARFAGKVLQLNAARLEGSFYPLLQEFAVVESQSGEETPSQLIDAYRALIEITGENPNADTVSHPDAIRERQYTDDYLDETPNSSKTMRIRKRILEGSRKALEKQFFNQLESLVSRNPREGNIGGIPTIINKVRAYVRIRNARRDLVPDNILLQILNDDFCWALIFFLLRSGYVKEAADYVSSNEISFRALDRNFITYITKYANDPERRLPRQLQDRINVEYQQRVRNAPENSLDPYRMACYKVVGRCELGKRSFDNISQGVEDWTWLQFALAREVNRVEEVAGEVFGLDEVRETVREIGQRHFQKGSEGVGGYATFFYLQILAGLFEQAVAYLYSYSYVTTVHFTISLDFYGLLRVSDFSASETELLTYNTKQMPQINFGRMIGYYTRDFRTGNVEAAVDYLILLCLNADLPGSLGKSQASLCYEALRELVLETREFSQLLGDVFSDGMRVAGAIELRGSLIGISDKEVFLRTVTLQAASIADDNGRTSDAVLLYHMAEDYDNVISIVNRALSDTIAVDIGQDDLRIQSLKPVMADKPKQQQPAEGSSLSLTAVEDPAELAKTMISLYDRNALYYEKIRPTNRITCGVLLQISDAKSRVQAQKWAEALDIISSLNLLPLNANSSVPLIRAAASTVASLQPTVSRLVGPLLLWTMTCISRQRDLLLGDGANGGFESETRRAMREDLAGRAKDLMVFAGLIKLRLGKGVWEGLVGGAGEVGAL